MLEDSRVSFAISQRGATPGVQHVGIQVENRAELEQVYERLQRAERPVLEERGHDVLLRAQREELDRRPTGSAVGDLFDHRGEHRLRA
jgi:hypothetical protein